MVWLWIFRFKKFSLWQSKIAIDGFFGLSFGNFLILLGKFLSFTLNQCNITAHVDLFNMCTSRQVDLSNFSWETIVSQSLSLLKGIHLDWTGSMHNLSNWIIRKLTEIWKNKSLLVCTVFRFFKNIHG